jgi:hypothetical protein
MKNKKILYLKSLSLKSEEDERSYIKKKRSQDNRKYKMWDKKCTEINTYQRKIKYRNMEIHNNGKCNNGDNANSDNIA